MWTTRELQDFGAVEERIPIRVEKVTVRRIRNRLLAEPFRLFELASSRQRLGAHVPPGDLCMDVIQMRRPLAPLRQLLSFAVTPLVVDGTRENGDDRAVVARVPDQL